MKYFLLILTLSINAIYLADDDYLCFKNTSTKKAVSQGLTKDDCQHLSGSKKCCLISIKSASKTNLFCGKVDGIVNDKTIEKIKEDLSEGSDVSIDCNHSKFIRLYDIILVIFLILL